MALRTAITATALLAGVLGLSACGHDQVSPELSLGPAFGLFYNDQGASVSLAYGQANSDDVALMLSCAKRSGKVDVSDVVRDSRGGRLILASDGRKTELDARLQTSESDAPRLIVAQTDMGAQALQGFRRSGRINVAYGAVHYGLKASQGERAGVEQFFSACSRT